MKWVRRGLGVVGMLSAAAVPAQPAAGIFCGANLALGRQLLKEHRCVECHLRNLGGDGSAIYRDHDRFRQVD